MLVDKAGRFLPDRRHDRYLYWQMGLIKFAFLCPSGGAGAKLKLSYQLGVNIEEAKK